MTREFTMDVLLRMGMPAGIRGTTYICDALEFFDADPYYIDGKVSVLYSDIARKRDTTASRVERAIRHAFEAALTRGNPETLEKYLDMANTQNSNLLKSLHFRIGQEKRRNQKEIDCKTGNCRVKRQIYEEAMNTFLRGLEASLRNQIESQY